MKYFISILLGGASLVTLSTAAAAQSEDLALSEDRGSGRDEIVVTARRKDENVQNVPAVVNPVTAETLQELNIRRMEDVSSLVPGLTLSSGTVGYTNMASMRGVTFDLVTSAKPTVEFYFNDAPVDSAFLFQAFFDVGQLEVLRGPQGTLRGRAAPSGAITLTSRAPDLDEFGGYAAGSINDIGTANIQAAIGMPIISGKLALRVAAVYDRNEINRVLSANSIESPVARTKAVRATLSFTPADDVSAKVIYQYIDRYQRAFDPVVGAGGPGGIVPGTTFPAPRAGFNGPVIEPGKRLGITDSPRDVNNSYHLLTGVLDWRFAGQKLSYVGSYTRSATAALRDQDIGNVVPGYSFFQLADGVVRNITQELRLSSEKPLFDGILDYTAGVFYAKSKNRQDTYVGLSFQPGAFGSPLAQPILAPPDERFAVDSLNAGKTRSRELSFFASLTAHLDSRTELAVGGRMINSKSHNTRNLTTSAGLTARALTAAACAGAGGAFGATYPAVCDIPIAARVVPSPPVDKKDTPFIYNATLSYRFTEDLMVYAGTGTSWRAGPTVVGITNGRNDPLLTALTFLDAEKSTNYELGFKSRWFDGKLHFNASVYHQKFKGFIIRGTPSAYLSDNGTAVPTVTNFAFTANADAKVTGVDLDATLKVTPEWSISGLFSYAKGKLSNAEIPCNDGNFDGVPDNVTPTLAQFQASGRFVALCASNGSTSRAPRWNATLQTEYVTPINPYTDIFARGLLNYFPKNPNQSLDFVVDNYMILNLYASLQGSEGNWQVTLFAKNITKANVMLSRDNVQLTSAGSVANYFGLSGYFLVEYTQPREFGISLRYAFGSR